MTNPDNTDQQNGSPGDRSDLLKPRDDYSYYLTDWSVDYADVFGPAPPALSDKKERDLTPQEQIKIANGLFISTLSAAVQRRAMERAMAIYAEHYKDLKEGGSITEDRLDDELKKKLKEKPGELTDEEKKQIEQDRNNKISITKLTRELAENFSTFADQEVLKWKLFAELESDRHTPHYAGFDKDNNYLDGKFPDKEKLSKKDANAILEDAGVRQDMLNRFIAPTRDQRADRGVGLTAPETGLISAVQSMGAIGIGNGMKRKADGSVSPIRELWAHRNQNATSMEKANASTDRSRSVAKTLFNKIIKSKTDITGLASSLFSDPLNMMIPPGRSLDRNVRFKIGWTYATLYAGGTALKAKHNGLINPDKYLDVIRDEAKAKEEAAKVTEATESAIGALNSLWVIPKFNPAYEGDVEAFPFVGEGVFEKFKIGKEGLGGYKQDGGKGDEAKKAVNASKGFLKPISKIIWTLRRKAAGEAAGEDVKSNLKAIISQANVNLAKAGVDIKKDGVNLANAKKFSTKYMGGAEYPEIKSEEGLAKAIKDLGDEFYWTGSSISSAPGGLDDTNSYVDQETGKRVSLTSNSHRGLVSAIMDRIRDYYVTAEEDTARKFNPELDSKSLEKVRERGQAMANRAIYSAYQDIDRVDGPDPIDPFMPYGPDPDTHEGWDPIAFNNTYLPEIDPRAPWNEGKDWAKKGTLSEMGLGDWLVSRSNGLSHLPFVVKDDQGRPILTDRSYAPLLINNPYLDHMHKRGQTAEADVADQFMADDARQRARGSAGDEAYVDNLDFDEAYGRYRKHLDKIRGKGASKATGEAPAGAQEEEWGPAPRPRYFYTLTKDGRILRVFSVDYGEKGDATFTPLMVLRDEANRDGRGKEFGGYTDEDYMPGSLEEISKRLGGDSDYVPVKNEAEYRMVGKVDRKGQPMFYLTPVEKTDKDLVIGLSRNTADSFIREGTEAARKHGMFGRVRGAKREYDDKVDEILANSDLTREQAEKYLFVRPTKDRKYIAEIGMSMTPEEMEKEEDRSDEDKAKDRGNVRVKSIFRAQPNEDGTYPEGLIPFDGPMLRFGSDPILQQFEGHKLYGVPTENVYNNLTRKSKTVLPDGTEQREPVPQKDIYGIAARAYRKQHGIWEKDNGENFLSLLGDDLKNTVPENTVPENTVSKTDVAPPSEGKTDKDAVKPEEVPKTVQKRSSVRRRGINKAKRDDSAMVNNSSIAKSTTQTFVGTVTYGEGKDMIGDAPKQVSDPDGSKIRTQSVRSMIAKGRIPGFGPQVTMPEAEPDLPPEGAPMGGVPDPDAGPMVGHGAPEPMVDPAVPAGDGPEDAALAEVAARYGLDPEELKTMLEAASDAQDDESAPKVFAPEVPDIMSSAEPIPEDEVPEDEEDDEDIESDEEPEDDESEDEDEPKKGHGAPPVKDEPKDDKSEDKDDKKDGPKDDKEDDKKDEKSSVSKSSTLPTMRQVLGWE